MGCNSRHGHTAYRLPPVKGKTLLTGLPSKHVLAPSALYGYTAYRLQPVRAKHYLPACKASMFWNPPRYMDILLTGCSPLGQNTIYWLAKQACFGTLRVIRIYCLPVAAR